MCLVLSVTIVSTQIQPKAHAEVLIDACVIGDVVEMLAIVGITFVTVAAAKALVQDFLTKNPDILDWANEIANRTGNLGGSANNNGRGNNMKLLPTDPYSLKALYNAAKSYFTGNSKALDNGGTQYNGAIITNYADDAGTLYNEASYGSGDSVTVKDKNGTSHTYSVSLWTSVSMYGYKMVYDGGFCYNTYLAYQNASTSYYTDQYCYLDTDTTWKSKTFKWGFFEYTDAGTGNTYLNPYIAGYGVKSSDNSAVFASAFYYDKMYRGSILMNSTAVAPTTSTYTFTNAPTYSPNVTSDDFYKAINNAGAAGLTVSTGAATVAVVTNDDTGISAINQPKALDDTGITSAVQTDVQASPTVAPSPVTDTENDLDVPRTNSSIKYKFPFCVPFDVIGLVQALNAKSAAPYWDIPVKIPYFDYTQHFTIDLSGDAWNKVATAIRWGETILFLLGLVVLTRKLIKG